MCHISPATEFQGMFRMAYSGCCLCGAVAFEVAGELSPPQACHCRQCRRQSGHCVVSSDARRADVRFTADSGLAWYRSSPAAERGFCRHCGSVLLWRRDDETLSINLGCLDDTGELKLAGHIFTADKGAYYDIADALPQYPGSG